MLDNFDHLSDEELTELLRLQKELYEYDRTHKIDSMFPDQGTDGTKCGFVEYVDEEGTTHLCSINPDGETWSRDKYQKSLDFFRAGLEYDVRMYMAANRSSKTVSAGCEVTYHTTGIYPHWWQGRRLTKPVRVHACGKDNKTVVDSLQRKLLGDVGDFGTGLIPKDKLDMGSLGSPQKPDTNVGTFKVKHISGGWSTVTFKTYDAGRKSFEGFESDFMWLDEEPPEEIYGEAAKRLMTTQGMLVMTFTPTNGITKLLETFFGDGLNWKTGDLGGGKYSVLASWNDVPHLTKKAKDQLYNLLPVYQRKAASEGIPELGSGLVYPVDHEQIFIDPIEIPKTWKRVAGMDFGWNDPTALVWVAIDPVSGIRYQYAEHYRSKTDIAIHAQVIKQHNKMAGFTIPIVCDPSGGGSSTQDGRHTRDTYKTEFDITMIGADNTLHPGLIAMLHEFNSGRYKIFKTCSHTKNEMSKYRYEDGKLKGDDHLLDCIRYVNNSGGPVASGPKPVVERNQGVSERYRIIR